MLSITRRSNASIKLRRDIGLSFRFFRIGIPLQIRRITLV